MPNKKNCSEEQVCSLFVILEKLEREGMFESFSENDYERAVDSMIEYFIRFKNNREKYEKFNEDRPYGNFINVISKYPFSLIDFNEPKGTVKLSSENGGGIEVLTKYDIKFEGQMDVLTHSKNGGVLLNYDLDSLNVELNYNRDSELMVLQEAVNQNILHSTIIETIMGNVSLEGLSPIIRERLDVFADFCKESTLMHHALERMGADKKIFNSYINDNLSRAFRDGLRKLEDSSLDYSGLVNTSDAPIFMNNEPFVGSFYDKIALIEKIVTAIEELQKGVFFSVLGIDADEDLAHDDFESMLEAVSELSFGVRDEMNRLVGIGVNAFQKKADNVITESIMKGQSGGSLYATQDLLARNLSSTNTEIIEKYTGSNNKDGVILSFDGVYKGQGGGKIHALPVYDKELIKTYVVEPYIERLSQNDPMKTERIDITPNVVKFTINFKKKESGVELVSFKEDFVRESVHTNDSMKYYMIDKGYLKEGKHKIFVIDEGDSKPDGKMAMVFKSVAKEAEHGDLASGTAVNGFPASIVPMLAYNGNMDMATVAQNKNEFTKQCGVYEINSKLLGKILYSNNNSEFKKEFLKFFEEYKEAITKTGEEKESGENIMKKIIDALKTRIMPAMINLELVEKAEIDDIEVGREARKVKTLFDSMFVVSRKIRLSFDELIKEAISSTHTLTKLVPSISSPLTYVQMIASTAGNANITIQTREGLSGKKETKKILDLEQFEKNFMSGAKNFEVDQFVKFNRGGVRLAQATLREYASVNFLYDTASYLGDNFKFFSKNFSEQKGKINKTLLAELTALANSRGIFGDHELSTGQVLTLLKKRTSSSSDSIDMLYKNHLDTNGDIRKLQEFKNMDENKYNLFNLMLEMFDSFMKEGLPKLNALSRGTNSKVDKDEYKGYKLVMDGGYEFDLTRSNFYFTEKFQSLDNEKSTEDIVNSLEKGYPQGSVFSITVDMCPHDLKHIIKKDENNKHLPFTINLKRREENQIFDAVGSLGYGEIIKRLYEEEKSAVVASTRTAGTFFNLVTTIDSIIRGQAERDSKEKTVIVLNEPASSSVDSFDFRELYSRIDKNLLAEHNIKIDKVKRNLLDSTVKGYRGDGFQTFVMSNYESASRGLDLSSLDEIVVTAGMAKGKEAIQFSARLFSVTNQEAKMSFFNGGNDASFIVPSAEDKIELINEVLDGATTAEEIGSVFTSLIAEEATGVNGEKNNRSIVEMVADIANANEDKNILTKTESSTVARLCKDKCDVYDQFMSGNSTSIDSAIGNVENKAKIDPVTFSTTYSDRNREKKLKKKEEAILAKVSL